MSEEVFHIFVYGSLMRGMSNHRLIAKGRFVQEDLTPPHYTLVDLGAYPAVITRGTTAVYGELYEVDEDILRNLDRLEGHPDFYRRTPIQLASSHSAEIYLLNLKLPSYKVIPSGDWRQKANVYEV
ncbi:MAG: gamma-glutamylcyclotransferase [Deltaproteobacteria bacterium]|nr:gamma-glutamylcyclotransferase [Deltaproteobacteria bacterium]